MLTWSTSSFESLNLVSADHKCIKNIELYQVPHLYAIKLKRTRQTVQRSNNDYFILGQYISYFNQKTKMQFNSKAQQSKHRKQRHPSDALFLNETNKDTNFIPFPPPVQAHKLSQSLEFLLPSSIQHHGLVRRLNVAIRQNPEVS